MTVAFAEVETPVGGVLVAVTEVGLVASGWRVGDGERARLVQALGVEEVEDSGRTAGIVGELERYFAGELRVFGAVLDWRLTSVVQRKVLETLRGVAYGKVVTYGELARLSGSGVPARGIGAIMGANPLPIVVPCHRVVAGNGLGGFSGGVGVETKRWLLTHEGYLQQTLLDL